MADIATIWSVDTNILESLPKSQVQHLPATQGDQAGNC